MEVLGDYVLGLFVSCPCNSNKFTRFVSSKIHVLSYNALVLAGIGMRTITLIKLIFNFNSEVIGVYLLENTLNNLCFWL